MFKKTVLDNGLRIITVPMQGTNTVTVLILCGTGSDYEKREERGISHVLEHMFFKGTLKRPDAGMIHHELDGMGALHNAFTSHEITGYFVKVGKGQFLHALDILADIYHNALLKQEELEKERLVIIEEMRMYRDTPTDYIGDIWERLLYGDQPAGWEIIGEEETVRNVNRKQLLDYFSHQYTSFNTAVIIAGNFEEEYALESVEASFRSIRHDLPLRPKPQVKEQQSAPATFLHYKETDQSHLMLGFRGYSVDYPRRYAAEVLGVLLGGGSSSRMFSRIREKLGLAYAISSDFRQYSNRGFLTTYAGVDHGNIKKAIEAMLEEYKNISREKIKDEELNKVKEYIRGTTLIGLEASNAVASFVGSEEMITGRPLTVEELFAKIDAVTAEDVSAAAKDLFRSERLNLAIIGPFKESYPFEKLLKEF